MKPTEHLKILAAAVMLGEFTVAELCAYSGANPNTAQSVLRREKERGRVKAAPQSAEGPGRPPNRWEVVDPDGIREEASELEDAIGHLRREPPPTDPDSDRLAAVISAEDLLLRSWDPEEGADRDLLTRSAAMTIADALSDDDLDDTITRRAQSVEVFARIAHEASRGERVGLDELQRAADALVVFATVAPDRIRGFLRGLTDSALRGGAVPPMAVVGKDDPHTLISGLPADVEWVDRTLPETDARLWTQSWCERLIDRGLIAGLVFHESNAGLLAEFSHWQVPMVVLGQEKSIDFVNQLTQQGAYFHSSVAPVESVADALTHAITRAPSRSQASAELALGESRSSRRRSEQLASIDDGKELALLMPLEAALFKILLTPEAAERGIPRADLAQRLRVDEGTLVTEVLGDTLADVVEELAPSPGEANESRCRVRHRRGIILALDIGPQHVRAARSDLRAELPPRELARAQGLMLEKFDRFRGSHPTVDDDVPAALDVAAELCQELLGENSPDEVVGLGLAIAHPMDARTGRRRPGVQPVNDWNHRSPIAELEKRLRWGRPILPINDANAGLLSEARFGAARYLRNVWHVRWMLGIGAGGLVDGRLYTGAGGIAGEIGHMPVILTKEHRESRPEKCAMCGHHCLDSVAGRKAIAKEIGYAKADLDMLLADLMLPESYDVAERAGFYVGQVLAQLTTLLNPELITIGGEFDAYRFEVVRSGIHRGLRQHAFPSAHDDVAVRPGERTGRAVLEGALVHVLREEGLPFLIRRAIGRGQRAPAETYA